MMVGKRPRILLVTTQSWPVTGHLAYALHEVGFELAAVFPKNQPLKCLDLVANVYATGALQFRRVIEKAVLEFAPNMVMPCDDSAVRHLYELHAEHFRGSGRLSAQIIRTIEDSLGCPNYYELVSKQSNLFRFGRRFGLPIPKTVEFTDEAGLQAFLATARFPLLLKFDSARSDFVRDENEGIEAYRRRARSPNWAKKLLAEGDLDELRHLFHAQVRTVSVQEYIDGTPAQRAVVCRNGCVLAGINAAAPVPVDRHVPATAVEFLDNPTMDETVEFIAGKLKLSGFYGFDFMLERDTGRVSLIEVRPRATPISHLVSDTEIDLPAALFAALAGAAEKRRDRAQDKLVALFPEEWDRVSNGEYVARSGRIYDFARSL